MARSVCILTILTVTFLLTTTAFARILYVTPQGNDANSGLSWTEAKRTVSAAIDAASSGDEIWVAAGTYYENLIMKGGLKLYGGFKGTETSLQERPPFPRPQPDPYETVLDGMQAGRVMTVPTTASPSVIIDGLTVCHGKVEGPVGAYGGGILCEAPEVHISNCTIANNVANRGGGVYVAEGSTVYISHCVIVGNSGFGGGVHSSGDVTVRHCIITQNSGGILLHRKGKVEDCEISANIGGRGAGAYVYSYTVATFSRCRFIANEASEYGGGLYFAGDAGEVTSCLFTRNTASAGAALAVVSTITITGCDIIHNEASNWGGGLYILPGGHKVIEMCTIANNTAWYGGGILCNQGAAPRIVDCTIAHNIAKGDGAGVGCYWESTPHILRCFISDNFAWRVGGGVICSDGSAPTIEQCLITRNRTLDSGAGLYATTYASPTVIRSTISNNYAVRDGAGVLVKSDSTISLQECTISCNTTENNGGGVYLLDNASAELTRCAVSYNTARNSGAGIYAYNSSPVVLYSMISGNSAGYYGGGVYCEWQSSPQVLNSLIVDNTAQRYGGGMYIYRECTPTITNCTFAFNTAPNQGGGIYTYGSSPSVSNTIVAFNTSGIFRSGGSPTLRYNCVYGNTAYNYKGVTDPTGTNGNISVNPRLTGHNGHLLPGSPCINAGENGAASSGWLDIDGESRIVGERVDIGADEFVPPTANGMVVFSDYNGMLPPVLDMEVRLGTASEIRSLWLGTDGSFTLPSAPTGVFSLSTKPSHWLRRTVEVDTSAGSVSGIEITLTNGDIDGDNEVSLFDFGQLVQAFGSRPGDENWNPNADLDGDGEVTLFDFGILVRYFGEMGDE